MRASPRANTWGAPPLVVSRARGVDPVGSGVRPANGSCRRRRGGAVGAPSPSGIRTAAPWAPSTFATATPLVEAIEDRRRRPWRRRHALQLKPPVLGTWGGPAEPPQRPAGASGAGPARRDDPAGRGPPPRDARPALQRSTYAPPPQTFGSLLWRRRRALVLLLQLDHHRDGVSIAAEGPEPQPLVEPEGTIVTLHAQAQPIDPSPPSFAFECSQHRRAYSSSAVPLEDSNGKLGGSPRRRSRSPARPLGNAATRRPPAVLRPPRRRCRSRRGDRSPRHTARARERRGSRRVAAARHWIAKRPPRGAAPVGAARHRA
jgi:hypothetical protein